MSTSETMTLNKGACPCGNGSVLQHITTQDNPWSSADIAYSISCKQCTSDYRIDGRSLILKESERPYIAAREAEAGARAALRDLTDELVDKYFESFNAPNKKAEHAEMHRLGITSMSYRTYLDCKRKGGTPATASLGTRNKEWILEQAENQGCKLELLGLISNAEAARDATQKAFSSVARLSIA